MNKAVSKQTTVALIGNSLTVRIPRQVAKDAGLRQGSSVSLTVAHVAAGPCVVIEPTEPPLTLTKLLEHATPENSGGEVEWGDSRGREAW